MYKEAFIEGWKDLKKNPLLLVPDILNLLVNLTLGFLFLKYSGILTLVTDPELLAKELEELVPIIKTFLEENLIRIVSTLAVFALTSFFIGSGLTAMRFGLMKEVMQKRKLTISEMINCGKRVWQVVSMKMIMFVIGATTFLFIIGTGLILSLFLSRGYVILIIGLLSPTIIVILQLLLFFRYQIMFLKNKHPFAAIKESFNYFIKKKKYVFVIWSIVLAISFTIEILSIFMGLTEQKIIAISLIIIIGYCLRTVVKLIINVWSEMFKFRSLNF